MGTNSKAGKIKEVSCIVSLKLSKSLSPYPLVCWGESGQGRLSIRIHRVLYFGWRAIFWVSLERNYAMCG